MSGLPGFPVARLLKYSIPSYLVIIAIPILLVTLGDGLILQQSTQGPTTELTIRGDAIYYLSMAEGHLDQIPSPFRYRVLVPFIAGLFPLSSTQSLLVISYSSLFACYVLALLICRHLRFSLLEQTVGLLSVYTSTWHLYNYHNPYLTDAFGLMVLFILVFAFLKKQFLTFTLAAVFGTLARESAIFLVPVWLAMRQWQKAIVVVLVAFVTLIVPRMVLTTDGSPDILMHFNVIADFLSFVKAIFLSWHFLWLWTFLGIFLISTDRALFLTVSFILLFFGALLSSFFATDIERMFSILHPVVVISCAQLFASLRKNRAMATVLILLLTVQLFLGMPTIVTPRESWAFATIWPRLTFYAAGTAFTLYAVLLLRREIIQGIGDKVRATYSGRQRKSVAGVVQGEYSLESKDTRFAGSEMGGSGVHQDGK